MKAPLDVQLVAHDEHLDFQHSVSTNGNPEFKPETHEASNDYFKLFLPLPKNSNKLPEVTSFLHRWMGLKPEETLDVKNLDIGKVKARNRFLATYGNSISQRHKDYYFDFDFSDGKGRLPKRIKQRQLKIALEDSDEVYNKQYRATLERNCEEIQRQLGNPMSIECKPFLNSRDYVADGTFDIAYKELLKGKEIARHKVVHLVVE